MDLSQNFLLQHLMCDKNQLTSLDISQNINLESLVATDNQLTCVQGSSYLFFWINFVGGPGAPWFALDEGVELSTQCSVSQNQRTYVPDDALEQALIDTGLDDVLDDYVNTIQIINRFILDISGRNISDLTGLEDFTGLLMLDASNNNLTSVDMSEWGYFDKVDFRDNPLSCIQINEFQQKVLGNRMIIETDNGVRISLDCGY
jgi:Leucine-rich repeat (LRR) protein